MSVPFPTPDGPAITITPGTRAGWGSAPSGRRRLAPAQQRDELAALALGQPAERLARRDPALGQDLVDLHAPVLGDREQQIEYLRGHHIIGRLEQQLVDRLAARFQVALELSPTAADVVRALQRLHPLDERPLGRGDGLLERFTDRRHGRRLYIVGPGDQGLAAEFGSTSS